MRKTIPIIFIFLFLLLILNYNPPHIFAQATEFLRTRVGSLAAKETGYPGGEVSKVEYFIAPEDVFEVLVWKNPDLSKEIIVGPDGIISYPLVGRIKVVGLTVSQLENKLREALAKSLGQEEKVAKDHPGEYVIQPDDVFEVYIWQNPDLSREIIVGPDGIISYPLVGRIKVAGLTILQLEQTLTERFSEYIKSPLVSIMMKKYVRFKAPEVYIMLKKFTGNKIIILGEVNYPGIYNYSGEMDLIEAIALAGYFTDKAHSGSVMIVRGNLTEKPKVIRINLIKAITKGTSNSNILLQPNDVVFVPKTFVANFHKFLSDLQPTMDNAAKMLSVRRTILGTGGRIAP